MNTNRKFLVATVAAFLLFCFTPSIFASDVSMALTSGGSTQTGTNVLDDSYVGAYTANINGVSTPVICDDYADTSYVPESWTASVSTFSNLSSTLWAQKYPGNYNTMYEQAAWLIEQMVSPANSSHVGDIQYALWDLFDPNAFADLNSGGYSSDLTNAENWLSAAQLPSNLAGLDLADFAIYTPTSAAATCNGQPCLTPTPQEFMTYGTPEPSLFAILPADLLLMFLAGMILRRRGILKAVR